MRKKIKILTGAYFAYLSALTFFSYTQVDLNLTLFSFGPYLKIQEKLTYLGYFQRPLNTFILAVLLGLGFLFWYLWMRNYKKISQDKLKLIVFLTGMILLFSYTMFSHDIFNYIFDARILTKYGLNPYKYKALDFPNDTWTRFMHWTHRTNPYPVLWTAYTLIPSVLGLQKFSITFYLFKLFVGVLPYFVSCYYLYKISSKHLKTIQPVVFFAFSPLVLFEFLVNSHNDLLMMAVFLFSLFKLLENKYFQSFIGLTASILVKYATAVTAPIYLWQLLKEKIQLKRIFQISFFLLTAAVVYYSYLHELQIWYLIWVFPLAALLFNNRFYKLSAVLSQMILLPFYLGFFYNGEWLYGQDRLLVWLISLVVAFSLSGLKRIVYGTAR